ncbi:MAG TPA: hypothetical protein PK771_15705 [Spirochaetota bacterium]|nr:hypothetical protein [Spirochaetota bacterium]
MNKLIHSKKIFIITIFILMILSCKKDHSNKDLFPVEVKVEELSSNLKKNPSNYSNISGVWGDALSNSNDGKYSGDLIIFENNGIIKAFSTTGNSIWFGEFYNNELSAKYYKDRLYYGKITLHLSEDANTLKGEWESDGSKGTYAAYKVKNFDIERIREELKLKFKKNVVIK